MTTLVAAPRARLTSYWASVRARQVVEWLALGVAPAIAFFALRVRPMAFTDIIDSSFYTAYAQHGADLVTRMGAESYYWTRLGFILPARLAYLIAGPLGGFYLFRYALALLAIIPAYLLMRRIRGPAAGCVVVAVILTSPVTYATWGSDYPDSAAFSYLIAGAALLAMPSDVPWRRMALRAGAAVLLTLAVHCHVVSLPLVLAIVAGYVIAFLRRDSIRRVATDLAILVGCAVVVTGLLSLIAYLWLGHANMISPNLKAYRLLQTPRELALWHSSNWRWVLTVPYVIVPFAACGGWLLGRIRGNGLDRSELSVGIGATLGVLAFAWMQFFGTVGTLEYHIYSSMLWSLTDLVVGIVLAQLLLPLLGNVAGTALAVTIVLVPALVWSIVTPHIEFGQFRWPLLIGAVWCALVILGLRLGGRLVAALAAVCAVLANLVLTTAVTSKPPLAHTASIPHGQYGGTLGHPSAPEVSEYAVVSQLASVVGPADHPGQRPVSWWPKSAWRMSLAAANMMSAQYLWVRLPPGMPRSPTRLARQLRRLDPQPLLLIGANDREFDPFLRVIADVGGVYNVVRRATLTHGALSMQVWVVKFEALPLG